jgi:outer membrane protein assembly factor BamB
MFEFLTPALLFLPLASSSADAQDWPHWRGPNFDGSSDVTGLPTDFSKEKHVAWAAELPGPGAGTPSVGGERGVLTASVPEVEGLVALAIDRDSGETLWEHAVDTSYRPAGTGEAIRIDDRSDYATPSPVSDGERVVFFFGNGELCALDLEGELLWSRNLQKDYGDFAFQWTFSSSPTIWNGLVHLPVLQRDSPVGGRGKEKPESFLLALHADSGTEAWLHPRPCDAQMESRESYATLIPYVGPSLGGGAETSERQALLMVGGDVITGHDPSSGKELWRWGTWNPGHREQWWRVVPSAVTGAGVALACGPKGAPVCAVRLDGEGELGEEGLVWQSSGRRNPITTDVPTPLFYQGRFYVLSDLRETLSAVNAGTGEVLWTLEMPGRERWRGSPTGADGMIWCVNHAGLVVVVDAESGKIVSEVAMGEEDEEQVRASLVAAHGSLFLRTGKRLYCIRS